MNRHGLAKRCIAYALSAATAYSGPLHAALADIADYPITQPASSSLNPNLLLILDDSGSMARQFSPDYVSSNTSAGTVRNCFDTRDGGGTLDNNIDECIPGDPPAMSPDFNSQYYNPEVRYLPAVDYDGSQRASMTSALTSGWASVPTDNVSAAGVNNARKDLTTGSGDGGTSGSNWDTDNSSAISTYDILTRWPDRVWCTAAGDASSNATLCKKNESYSYPSFEFGYGKDALGNVKFVYGAPYYYRIVPSEYCTNARMDNCVPATAPTVVAGVSYSVPAPVRFCTDSTLTDCHAKRSSTRTYPKFLGRWNTGAGVAAQFATGTITVETQPDAGQGNITAIRVTKPDGTVYNLSDGRTLDAGDPRNDWAEEIRAEIAGNPNGLSPAFSATRNNNVVTITAPTGGVDFNGSIITVVQNVTGSTPAFVDITFTGTADDRTYPGNGEVSSLIVDGLEFVGSTIRCTHTDCDANSSTRNARMAATVRASLVPPTGWTVGGSGSTVRITAPSGTGVEKNGTPVTIETDNTTGNVANSGALGGGGTIGDVLHTTTNFSGGADAIPASTPGRIGVGTFVRTNIVPGNTYNRYGGRTDCVAQVGVCTYEEEMTNFANWFAYYRTRMQMAKTAIGRAISLAALPDNWRLGFMTINFASSKYRAVAPFTTGAGNQRDNWYQELYEAPASGGTPLRTALSRAGRYFANQNPDSMGSTPINSACQPNFAVLTSDGYWNDSGTVARRIDGTSIGDADGDGSSNTLADVAHYYYNTDLSTGTTGPGAGFSNQVPPSGIDTAPHQHMTTFTVGMGISGRLLFHPNYLEPGNSLDYDAIVDGNSTTTPNTWPTPTADSDTTVDDMWHAAVNGRGRFFSAQNPVALAAGINEVLSSIAQRIGAGAAAATSNLQPVAGDNFAFTAQYSTVEWSGDLKARTISLIDGTISNRELWSAATQLDQRAYSDRVIYTFDATDTDASAIVTVNGVNRTQNANRLRSFCRIDASATTYPTCDDGGLLTQQEQDDYFDPLGGASGALSQAGGWPTGDVRRTAATQSSLIRFLRGETAKEITLGGTTAEDLYRNRAHLLGDIVNAQPAYVKSSPFSYADPFYVDFRNSTNGTSGTRKGTVYVAANDGMLHAFETDPDGIPYYQNAGVSSTNDNSDDTFTGTNNVDPITGEGAERWAYVPELIFPTLKRLAESNYATNHRFFTDGSPQIGDVCFGHTSSTPCSSVNNWRTILVGGLNAGGRGYYALDITDPDNPRGLWELKGGSQSISGGAVKCLTDAEANSGAWGMDCNIGLTYGNPVIVKRPSDGRWVVLLTSGYNNVSPGDGKGYLYVVDAQSGLILRRMSTGVGDTGTPSGLARVNAWVDSALVDNTAKAVYGGDLEGNLWRFQLDNDTAVPIPPYSVTRLARVFDPSGAPQPITVRPELAQVSAQRVVYFGTGKFLGSSDKTNNQRQSIYAIKDALAGAGDSTPEDDAPQSDMTRVSATSIANFVRQELTEDSTSTRTVTTVNPVNFLSDKGWFIDLPDGGTGGEAAERASVDPIIQLGTLVIPSNVPSSETCVAGGFGWVNFLDIKTGGLIQTGVSGTPASTKVSGSLIVGINVIKIGDQVKTIVTTADNQQLTQQTPVTPSGVEGRRVTWRELFVE